MSNVITDRWQVRIFYLNLPAPILAPKYILFFFSPKSLSPNQHPTSSMSFVRFCLCLKLGCKENDTEMSGTIWDSVTTEEQHCSLTYGDRRKTIELQSQEKPAVSYPICKHCRTRLTTSYFSRVQFLCYYGEADDMTRSLKNSPLWGNDHPGCCVCTDAER